MSKLRGKFTAQSINLYESKDGKGMQPSMVTSSVPRDKNGRPNDKNTVTFLLTVEFPEDAHIPADFFQEQGQYLVVFSPLATLDEGIQEGIDHFIEKADREDGINQEIVFPMIPGESGLIEEQDCDRNIVMVSSGRSEWEKKKMLRNAFYPLADATDVPPYTHPTDKGLEFAVNAAGKLAEGLSPEVRKPVMQAINEFVKKTESEQ